LDRVAVGDDDARPGTDKFTRDRSADARGASGDKRGFLGEGKHLDSAPHLLAQVQPTSAPRARSTGALEEEPTGPAELHPFLPPHAAGHEPRIGQMLD